MIKKLLLSILGLILCLSIFAQNQTDSIKIFKVFGGYRFESKGNVLTYGNMLDMMKDNPEAYQFMSKAKSTAGFANVLGFAGSFMIGWPIGTALGGGKPNWILAGVGCGLLIIAIPISSSANNNALIAIKKYNSSINGLSYQNQYDLKLGLCPNGLSLKLMF
jgi:hypothetical protein